ncbi:hypothetical protein BDZ45DRAFT_811743 [Acephala macrosclerotiorum]|nr:hypothetical protein BDZ45DRAFT_811743 [Acephala macrosclerotiorum]
MTSSDLMTTLLIRPMPETSNYTLIEGITVDEILKSDVATTFDFVIVGGGPRGLTLAMRLTEDPTVRVTVVEKGAPSKASFTFQLGELATSTFVGPKNPALMLALTTSTLRSQSKQTDIVNTIRRGRRLVGRVTEDSRHTLEGLKARFRSGQKSVKFTPPNVNLGGLNSSDIMFNSTSFLPKAGPLQTGIANYVSPSATWIKLTWHTLGVKPASGFNSGTLEGVQNTPSTSTLPTNIALLQTQCSKQLATAQTPSSSPTPKRRKSPSTRRTLLLPTGDADRPGVGQNLQDQSFVGITYEVNFNTTSRIFNAQFVDFANESFSQGLGLLANALDFSVFEGIAPEFDPSLSPSTQAALSQLPSDWPIYQYLPVNADLLISKPSSPSCRPAQHFLLIMVLLLVQSQHPSLEAVYPSNQLPTSTHQSSTLATSSTNETLSS